MSSPLQDEERLSLALDGAKSMGEVLERLGLRARGGNYSALRRACAKFGLTVPVFEHPGGPPASLIPLENILIENSTYSNRQRLKVRLVAAGMLDDVCYGQGCTVDRSWLGKLMVLQLEHINGVANDNRIENLAILCPNCHSQTDTFCGKNKPKVVKRSTNKCDACFASISPRSSLCLSCAKFLQPTKVVWPDSLDLARMVEKQGYRETGRSLGVSDNAVRKRLTFHPL